MRTSANQIADARHAPPFRRSACPERRLQVSFARRIRRMADEAPDPSSQELEPRTDAGEEAAKSCVAGEQRETEDVSVSSLSAVPISLGRMAFRRGARRFQSIVGRGDRGVSRRRIEDVNAAVEAAAAAFPAWPIRRRWNGRGCFSATGNGRRELRPAVRECLARNMARRWREARGSLFRGIENIEYACGFVAAHG